MGKERQRTRVKSKITELPEDTKKMVDDMLLDTSNSYQDIAEKLTEIGFEVSKSSVGRYALKQNAVINRLKEAAEQTKVIVNTIQENQNLDAAGAANALLLDGLTKKFALAQEEFENMPLDKAARITVALERTAVYRKKFQLEFNKGYKEALAELKKELATELQKEPQLLQRMIELADKVHSRVVEEEE